MNMLLRRHHDRTDGETVEPGEVERTPEEQAAYDAELAAKAAEATKHGDLDRPGKTAKTEDWVAYAQADPDYQGPSLEPRTGLRDEIATHYLGASE